MLLITFNRKRVQRHIVENDNKLLGNQFITFGEEINHFWLLKNVVKNVGMVKSFPFGRAKKRLVQPSLFVEYLLFCNSKYSLV